MQDTITISCGGVSTQVKFLEHLDVRKLVDMARQVAVFDANTYRLFADGLQESVVLPEGEGAKSWQSVVSIVHAALAADLGRDDTIIAIGGGIVCDVAAFSASVFMRGCQLVLVPTTLLAMVDAAIGGKTALNFEGYKNIVGTFYPAKDVRVCIEVLQRLPEREYRSGMGEVVKTAMLGDQELFDTLRNEYRAVKSREPEVLKQIVRRCIVAKANLINRDLREAGDRVFLNLGHTFAHALESVTMLKDWSHGEAVGWGIRRALELGVRLGITRPEYQEHVIEILRLYGLVREPEGVDPDALIAAMRKDKKKRKGELRFVLQEALCATRLVAVDEQIVRQIFT